MSKEFDCRFLPRRSPAGSNSIVLLMIHVLNINRWDMGGFVELADRLSKDLKAHVVLLGGPEEIERNKEIASRTNSSIINIG